MAYIKDNPDSYKSVKILSVMSSTFGKKNTAELFDILSDSLKKTEEGIMVSRYLKLFADPQIGDKYTDFAMATPAGDTLRLSDFEGKVVLLEFWASWCKGCLYKIPNLKNAYSKYNDKGFEIFAVSYDIKEEDWVNKIESENLIWQHVSELKTHGNTADLIYGITGIPDNFLIDKNGYIVARDLRGKKLEREIAKLLDD